MIRPYPEAPRHGMLRCSVGSRSRLGLYRPQWGYHLRVQFNTTGAMKVAP